MIAPRTFSTLAVASAATGIALSDKLNYAVMAEISSFVLGFALYTHELADKTIAARVHRAIFDQLPDLPNLDEARLDWKAAAQKALAAYGDTVKLQPGSGVREEHPAESLARLTGRPDDIIVVEVNGGEK